MSLHDDLLRRLSVLANVELVASLRDNRIGFSSQNDLRIFLPDLHLMTDQGRRRFPYWMNNEALLTGVLRSIADMRASSPGKRVALYQMGDCLDVWRESPFESTRDDAAARIKDDHVELASVLFGDDLKAAFMFGNHDFDLYQWPDYSSWQLHYFLTDEVTGQRPIIALHGDQFHLWEKLMANPFKHWFIHLFSPVDPKHDYYVGQLKDLTHADQGDYANRIAGTVDVGRTMGAVGPAIPDRWNVRTAPNPSDAHEYLGSSQEYCAALNSQLGLQLRVVVIGHTHHARLAAQERADGSLFVLVDTGAWIENCLSGDGAPPRPSSQLTAISMNEIRIYQLSPR